jgi:hypothetical protein
MGKPMTVASAAVAYFLFSSLFSGTVLAQSIAPDPVGNALLCPRLTDMPMVIEDRTYDTK